MANWATAYPAIVNCEMLTKTTPNCERTKPPQANWPMAMMPFAGTGMRFGRYLNDTCSSGQPKNASFDLYSNPNPSHFSRAGNGAPQWGHAIACSEISRRHSRHGFIYPPASETRVRSSGFASPRQKKLSSENGDGISEIDRRSIHFRARSQIGPDLQLNRVDLSAAMTAVGPGRVPAGIALLSCLAGSVWNNFVTFQCQLPDNTFRSGERFMAKLLDYK